MTLSERIQATAEVCNPFNKKFSDDAIKLFIDGLKDFPPQDVKDALDWYGKNQECPLTLPGLIVRLNEIKRDRNFVHPPCRNYSGVKFTNRDGIERPIEELVQIVKSCFRAYQWRDRQFNADAKFSEWIELPNNHNLKVAIEHYNGSEYWPEGTGDDWV